MNVTSITNVGLSQWLLGISSGVARFRSTSIMRFLTYSVLPLLFASNLLLAGCGGAGNPASSTTVSPTGTTTQPATPAVPVLPTVTAAHAPTYTPIKTYADQTGSYVVHPSILDFGSTPWNGHRYWMVINPFTPTQHNRVENPTIYYSEDGDVWLEPPGISNPLDLPSSDNSALSDPHLFVGPNNTLYVIYREYGLNSSGQKFEALYYRTSTDGVHWSARTTFLQSSGTVDYNHLTSPSAVYKDGVFYLWDTDSFRMELRMGSSLETLGAAQWCDFGPEPISKYHHDEIYYNGKFRSVIQEITEALRYAESYDGIHWSISPRFLDLGSPGTWDDIWMYRATFTPTPTGYDLWYSARGTGAETAFRFGRTKMVVTPWTYVPF